MDLNFGINLCINGSKIGGVLESFLSLHSFGMKMQKTTFLKRNGFSVTFNEI